MLDAPPMGRLVALNLTKGEGGVGNELTPEIIERAVRHGVGTNGRALRIMPSDDFQYLTDDDLRAVVSYVHARRAGEQRAGADQPDAAAARAARGGRHAAPPAKGCATRRASR